MFSTHHGTKARPPGGPGYLDAGRADHWAATAGGLQHVPRQMGGEKMDGLPSGNLT